MNSGIYEIVNKINGKKYIGSSKDIRYRWTQNHKPQLRAQTHHNRHLQFAWNKYGEENFEFKELELCDENVLLEREGFWIEKTRSWEREFGYNLVRIVDGNQVYSEETLDLLSKKIRQSKQKDYWTTGTNAEILKLFHEGMSKNQIAINLGITRSAVYSCLEQNELHENTGAGSEIKLTNEVKKQVKQLRKEGKTAEEIIEITGVSKTQLYRTKILKDGKYGGKVNRESYRTITPEVISKAQELRRTTKMTWGEIAKECGVSREWLSSSGACKGFESRRGHMDEIKHKQALLLREQGLTWKLIAKKLGVSTPTLRKYIT